MHLLEYSLQIIDSDIVEVTGYTKTGVWAPRTAWKDDTNEDEGFATVRFSSGAWQTLGGHTHDYTPQPGHLPQYRTTLE